MNSPGMVVWCSFIGTMLLVSAVLSAVYEAFFRYPASLRKRLNDASGKSREEKRSLLLDIKRLAESASKAPSDWRLWMRVLLEQSGMHLDTRALLAISLAMGVATATGIVLITRFWWTAPIGLVVGQACPIFYVMTKRRIRINRLTSQLPDALDVICRAVKVGQTVPATFQMVADDFPPPISDEFRYCYEQQNLGISYDTALQNLARATGIMELRILVVALLVQSRSGGNLTELLHNLATMVRKRLVLQQKVRALTGEGRMQATVLIALPFIAFIAMYVLNREYAQVLLDRPFVLAGCAVSQAIGAFFIKKLITIDY